MCGIAGVLEFFKPEADGTTVESMTQTLVHRGPDDGHVVTLGPVALGHRRLSIIDLSPGGRQPMANGEGSLWITFNGEIYNHAALRQQLTGLGHHFHSASDTEVILHAYAAWGVACLDHFHGMFAFAIWDAHRRCLWLARDRLGIKPLFYAQLADCFIFASEIKALLAHPAVPRRVDYEALGGFLAFNYVPAPMTLLQNIRQVMPGCHLTVHGPAPCQETPYWEIPYPPSPRRSLSVWREELDHLMNLVVKDHLVADVPCGAFLSGGVDSSGIVHWMTRQSATPVATFTMGFDDGSFDERGHAQQVADHCGTDHHSFVLPAESADILPLLVRHAEEPTADASMLAVYRLAQETRPHVKVVLCGDGADEIFAGYETYTAHYLRRLFRILPAPLRRGVGGLANRLLAVGENKVGMDEKIRRFLRGAELSAAEAHASWRIIHDRPGRQEILSPDLPAACRWDPVELYAQWLHGCPSSHPVNAMLYADSRFYLPNDMLIKVDRATMAHGLEARVPFLDHRLVEFAAGVPPGLKLHHFIHKKYLLKKTLAPYLPRSVLDRAKAGFNIPNKRWLRDEWRPFVQDHLAPHRLRRLGWFREGVVERMLQRHFARQIDASHQIWGLLVLVLWYEIYLA